MRAPSPHVILTAFLVAFAAGLYLVDPEPIARFRLLVFDAYQKMAPRSYDPQSPVRIVDIDEASLAKLGQWPWARTQLAKMLDNLTQAGARTIALDMVLSETDRLSPGAVAEMFEGDPQLAPLARAAKQLPSNDDVLAEAISKAPAVLGVIGIRGAGGIGQSPRAAFTRSGEDPKSFIPTFGGGFASLPKLSNAAKGLGTVNWNPRYDQIIRHVPLLFSIDGKLFPSLTLESLRVAEGQSTIIVRASGSNSASSFGQNTGVVKLKVGSMIFPTEADGQMRLRFTHSDPRRSLSAHRVISGDFDKSEVAGKYIFIGASAAGLLDLQSTPLELAIPGVSVHAQALEQLLSGDYLLRPDYATGLELLFILLAGSLVSWLISRTGPQIAAVIGLSSILAVALASWLAFTQGGLLFDPVYPSLALILIYSAITLLNYTFSDRDRARVRSAFAHYMAPALVDELAANPDRLKLGGETRNLTVLFSDVRGFSRLSEGMAADTLVQFVNRLFTPLTDVILEERGTIDKYIGDAVMAFWNAPLDDPDHARNACRAALRMVGELERLNVLGDQESETTGRPHSPIRLGIGLNTGECCVGNLGSPQRFDYSIIGESVNVASRLEGVTKIYGVAILAGQSTADDARDFAFLHIDTIVPRGKDRPENAFALLGDELTARQKWFAKAKEHTGAYLVARNEKNASGARTALTALENLGRRELSGLCAAYDAQLKEMAR